MYTGRVSVSLHLDTHMSTCALPPTTPCPKTTLKQQVVCRMKRMGGGFGGKETRSVFISCTAALAAHLTQRPVRVTLDRDVDMLITGQRHAFVAKYARIFLSVCVYVCFNPNVYYVYLAPAPTKRPDVSSVSTCQHGHATLRTQVQGCRRP